MSLWVLSRQLLYMGQHGEAYRSSGALGLGECCEFIVPLNDQHTDWSWHSSGRSREPEF